MNVQTVKLFVVLVAALLVLSGCPASLSGDVYTRGQARSAQDVQFGTVISTRQVLIEGTKSGVGTLSGAALGGIAASNIGGGRGQIAATIGGGLLGGLAGAAAEEGLTRQPGLEITVRLDSGRVLSVTQAADVMYSPGERVRVLTGAGGTSRVVY